MRVCWKSLIYHILKSVLQHNAICPSKHKLQKVSFWTWCHVSFRIWCYVSFRTWIGSYFELKHKCSFHWRTISEIYPYPKGKHNGAVGPKYASITKYLFHNFFFRKVLKVSCTFQWNHQATGLKKYEFTTIVLKTTNPYLPDRVEFKLQFVKYKAGHVI